MTINASQLHVWFYLISPKQQPITLMFSSNMLIDRLYFFPLFILFACIQQAARFISQVFNINRGKNFLERRSCLLYFREQVSFTYSRIIFPSLVIYNFISWQERGTFVNDNAYQKFDRPKSSTVFCVSVKDDLRLHYII